MPGQPQEGLAGWSLQDHLHPPSPHLSQDGSGGSETRMCYTPSRLFSGPRPLPFASRYSSALWSLPIPSLRGPLSFSEVGREGDMAVMLSAEPENTGSSLGPCRPLRTPLPPWAALCCARGCRHPGLCPPPLPLSGPRPGAHGSHQRDSSPWDPRGRGSLGTSAVLSPEVRQDKGEKSQGNRSDT